MIQDYFINKIVVKNRKENVVYEDWIAKKKYTSQDREIACRVSSLNYKDLQLLSYTDDVQRTVRKLYTEASVDISPKDLVVWEWKEYTVIAKYKPQDKTNVHHNKYFIKLVE